MTRDDCARAAAMLRDLDAADAAGDVRAAADLERGGASMEWLAAHLESCAHCSSADDPAAEALLSHLRADDDSPSEADLAASHARVMQAIGAEPSVAGGVGDSSEGAAARPRVRLAPRSSGSAGRPPREAVRPAAGETKPRPRAATARRLGYGLAIAASVLLAMFAAERLPQRFAGPAPAGPGPIARIAPVEIQDGGGGGDADAIWLVAGGDPFADGGATAPADLNDDDLEDLARQLGAVQG
jgi:hypothetical protein